VISTLEPTSAITTAAPAEAQPAVIQASGLLKSIDDRPILCGINLEIFQGEYVGILGANGAGKSTLLRVLATLTPPSGGELRFWGTPARKTGPSLRRRIGLIDHNLMLYRDLTAADNLEFFAKLYALANPRGTALRMLGRLGLRQRANDPVKSFSRGMAQRVAIGRALLHEPDLLLADEPFTGLDSPSIAAMEHVFAELRDAGRTIVLVNHDMEQTMRMVDRLIVLRRGRISIDQHTHRLHPDEVMAEVSAP
jgi:heme exporter protein A